MLTHKTETPMQPSSTFRTALLLIFAFTLGIGAQLLQAQVDVRPRGLGSLLKTDGAGTAIIASGSAMTISIVPTSTLSGGKGDRVVCVSATTGKIYFGSIVDAFGCR